MVAIAGHVEHGVIHFVDRSQLETYAVMKEGGIVLGCETEVGLQLFGEIHFATARPLSFPEVRTTILDIANAISDGVKKNDATMRQSLSTGVGLRMVTPVNPRAIVMQDGGAGFQILSFARGEPLVELIASDPMAQTLRFFALQFHPQCESSTGCSVGDLLTPAIEIGWAGYTLLGEDALANTPRR